MFPIYLLINFAFGCGNVVGLDAAGGRVGGGGGLGHQAT